MCGILGFSSSSGFTSDSVAINLLFAWNNGERGGDGSGIWMPKTGLVKSKEPFPKLFAEKSDVFYNTDKIVIGHVRKRSHGTIDDKSAQPFLEDRGGVKPIQLIGVHNGHITNHYHLKQEYCESMQPVAETDSHGLFQCIASAGHEWGLDPIRDYEGSAALLFTDALDPKQILYAYRDNTKPLYRGRRWDGMYISSIEESLKAIECDDVQEFLPNRVYVIREGKILYQIPIDRSVTKSSGVSCDYSRPSAGYTNYSLLARIREYDRKKAKGKWCLFDANWHSATEKTGDWSYCEDIVEDTKFFHLPKIALKLTRDFKNYWEFWATGAYKVYNYTFNVDSYVVFMVDSLNAETGALGATKGTTAKVLEIHGYEENKKLKVETLAGAVKTIPSRLVMPLEIFNEANKGLTNDVPSTTDETTELPV